MTMPEVRVPRSRRYERLTQQDCLLRLRPGGVGRLAFADGPMPVIVPVNFGMLDQDIVLRTAEGTVIDGLLDGAGVALEVDQVDMQTRLAWSVLVRGIIRHVRDAAELQRCEAVAFPTFAPGQRANWLRIETVRVTGRIIR